MHEWMNESLILSLQKLQHFLHFKLSQWELNPKGNINPMNRGEWKNRDDWMNELTNDWINERITKWNHGNIQIGSIIA